MELQLLLALRTILHYRRLYVMNSAIIQIANIIFYPKALAYALAVCFLK